MTRERIRWSGTGRIARNAFSDQMFLAYYRVAVPVKVIGTLEKWNPTTWKTDAYYGNPLTGVQFRNAVKEKPDEFGG